MPIDSPDFVCPDAKSPPRRISYAGLPLLFTQCNAATSVPVYLYLSRTRWHSPGLQLAVLTVRWSGVTSVAGEKTLVAARVVSVWFRGRRSGRDTGAGGAGGGIKVRIIPRYWVRVLSRRVERARSTWGRRRTAVPR